jgi:hypothetical protein
MNANGLPSAGSRPRQLKIQPGEDAKAERDLFSDLARKSPKRLFKPRELAMVVVHRR